MTQENRITKQISVEELIIGMTLGAAVYNTQGRKLLDKGFTIASEHEIQKIHDSGQQNVLIDLGSLIVGAETELDDSGKPGDAARKDAAIWEEESDDPVYIIESLKEELTLAREIYNSAKKYVNDLMRDVRMGKNIDNEQIAEISNQLVESMVRNPQALLSMVNLKKLDEYTFNHSINVTTLAVSIARQLGVSKDGMRQIGIGSLLHDVGKARIPLEIINKPGKLSNEEFAIIKKHPVFGSDICLEEKIDDDVVMDIVRHHHESYSGGGYPDRLDKTTISKYAAIAAISDVYDALTTARSYKKRFSPPEAIRIINNMANEKFDRRLVNHFIKIIGIFPVGSVVKLRSGRVAIIIGFMQNNLLNPLIRILINEFGEKSHITSVLELDEIPDTIVDLNPGFVYPGKL
ncbi:MAG: HD-GYP domain-containing protein, partial [Candidatus Cloacimonetes bacterium]|nr:HD-GYP domain-containing protein [Candidatus Cloacimonadota bacterium]